jgi:transposase-like protein
MKLVDNQKTSYVPGVFGIIELLQRATGAVLETPAGLTERHRRSTGMRTIASTHPFQQKRNDETQAMYADYLSGLSMDEVARKYGVTQNAIWCRFQKRGLPRRPRHDPTLSPVTLADDGTARIELLSGQIAIIDAEDIALVEGARWSALVKKHTTYAVSNSMNQGTVLLHRLIMHAEPGEFVDHINHDGLDNRRSNLRLCSTQVNNWNTRKKRSNTSGYIGVSWHKAGGKWRATFGQKHIGGFDSKDDAARAYDAYVRANCDEYATVNFPEESPCA